MKKKKPVEKDRQRVPARRVREEGAWVMRFALSHIVIDRGVRGIHTMDIFEHYKKWLKKTQGEVTQLNVDGFGRLFPKNFDRSMLSIDGKSRMAVRHVRVVGA